LVQRELGFTLLTTIRPLSSTFLTAYEVFVAFGVFAVYITLGGRLAFVTLAHHHMFFWVVKVYGDAIVKNIERALKFLCWKLFHI